MEAEPREENEDVIFAMAEREDIGELQRVEGIVDSAAVDHVMPEDKVAHVRTRPSAGSKRGQKWVSASRHDIHNEGEKVISFRTDCEKRRRMTFQIAKVGKTLISVERLNESGHEVILSRGSPRILCPNGDSIRLRRKNRVFIMDMWVRKSLDFIRP